MPLKYLRNPGEHARWITDGRMPGSPGDNDRCMVTAAEFEQLCYMATPVIERQWRAAFARLGTAVLAELTCRYRTCGSARTQCGAVAFTVGSATDALATIEAAAKLLSDDFEQWIRERVQEVCGPVCVAMNWGPTMAWSKMRGVGDPVKENEGTVFLPEVRWYIDAMGCPCTKEDVAEFLEREAKLWESIGGEHHARSTMNGR